MSRKLTCLAAVCLVIALTGSTGAQELGKGKVLFEYWLGGGINNNVDTLKANADFPNNPAQSEWRDGMDRPDWANMDYWGARARAFLTPTESGEYTFWTASDDDSEVWLSTDANEANAVMICNVEGWNNYQDWTGASGAPGANRKSAPVTLEAGKKYYMELLFSDGTGGGHASVAWAGPGIGETPVVLKGDVLTAFIRDPEPLLKAQTPDPANGKLDVTNPLFTWANGATAVMHDVYVGTNPVLGPNDFVGTQPFNMYFHVAGLTPGVTYYWRVDETDAAGNKYEGTVWSFTAMPLTAHFPSPYDGALWRSISLTASWTAGQGATSHIVYADTNKDLVAAGDPNVLLATVAEPMIDATGLLEPATTYYWRVDEVDAAGTVSAGDVWTFSTFDPEGGALAQYFGNKTLSGDPNVVTIVPEINFNWPGAVVGVDSPDVNIPVDNFSCRWIAALNVPVSGKYTLYDASDDGARLFLNGQQIAGNWVDRGTTEDASAELDLVAGERYVIVMEMYEAGGGASAYLRWSGPGIPKEIIPQGALQLVTWATIPQPANGAEGRGDTPVLSWVAGYMAASHDVYLSTDKALVTNGDAKARVAQQAETSFAPAALKWNTTYYWKVDEVAADGSVVAGDVWSFAVADYIPVIDEAVTITYDNTADPFITELAQEYDAPQDWTKNGVTSLQLQLIGGSPKASVSGGTVTLQAAGADIWGNADEFRYLYKTLNGDGSMIARVVDKGIGTNEWAKGGVMIRASTAAGSTHAFMPLTTGGGNGASFQRRLVADNASSNFDSPTAIAAPYWVKVDRVGDSFTGSISVDANEWTPLGDPIVIDMNDPVLIGLAVTSHVAGELRTFTFDGIATTGDVTGDWAIADIGVAQGGNDPAPVYVALVDADGNSKAVSHPVNPNVVMAADWMDWKILTSSFSGVNMKKIQKVIVGVGDGNAGGTGSFQVANVRVVKPITIAVENPSFEQPNASAAATKLLIAPPGIRFENVAGWKVDKAPTNSSVRTGVHPTNGSWAAFLWGGEPAIWQVTGHTIVDGEAFQVDVDASVVLGAVRDDKDNMRISLFYDDGGKRVTIGTAYSRPPAAPHNYSLSVSAADARKGAGKKLGVEIANVRDNGIGVDNVRLKTK